MYAKAFRVSRLPIVFPTFESFVKWESDNNISLLSHLTQSSQSMVNDVTGETYIVKFF